MPNQLGADGVFVPSELEAAIWKLQPKIHARWTDKHTDHLVDAAEEYATDYEQDERCIKTDVLNAFYHGADWQRKRATAAGEAVAPGGEAEKHAKIQAKWDGDFAKMRAERDSLKERLFKALDTDKTLAVALHEVDHVSSSHWSPGIYSQVLDIAAVHIARVKELEAQLAATVPVAAPLPSPMDERVKFETVAISNSHAVDRMLANPEIYDCNHTQVLWEGWQLRAAASPSVGVQTDAARDVLAERQRQITAEGYDPAHDDEHGDGSMAVAAACYALWAMQTALSVDTIRVYPTLWRWTGWAEKWFKPKSNRYNLIRAGALILAEIERIDRAAGSSKEGSSKP